MMFVTALCLWLHDMATVMYIGFFLLQVLVCLPVFRLQPGTLGFELLVKTMKRFQPLAGISLLVFLVSGVVLMLVNPDYHGLGQFSNRWSIVMMLKHVVIIGMVFLSFRLQTQVERADTSGEEDIPQMESAGRMMNFQSVLGVLVLFLTALARMG